MANQDYFAEIAMTKHPLGCEDKEILPVVPEHHQFQPSTRSFPENVRFSQDISDEQRYTEFKEELAQMRQQYAPYLRNLLPKQEYDRTELKTFSFRYLEEHEIFSQRDREADWETIQIPDYRGPEEKWRAYYKTTFSARQVGEFEHAVIHFQCVDYKARVYINGCYVGDHEGFFAPFEFDVTDYIVAGEDNELIIEVFNDISILGKGPVLDGDKIYAATGPGWDDPVTGWHHCPAGAGVFGKVTFEYRPTIYIDDVFVRPLLNDHAVELRVGVINYDNCLYEDYEFEACFLPKNFEDPEFCQKFQAKIKVVGVGRNEYRYHVNMTDYRLWELETPYLYGAICTISQQENKITSFTRSFGMRSFVSDENSQPKGKFYFNNKPILLRGANEMGHLQQCVMNGDLDQLIDDILIAKMCHMNYYRLTQRPVQEEIYDYMDMLGMFAQTDLPLFSFLRRPQVVEAVKQAGEMEHLLRSHPCSILVTFINEPVCIRRTEDPESKYSKRYDMKGHRHLLRDELEAFFVAARKIIYIENPDRVIKNVEGDYDPPTSEGMPDFHCYTMWYSNHGVPIGKLMRGYLPPVKAGWMIGCGEYGAEGLDNENIMWERYPKEWMEPEADGSWYPTKIVRAQTNGAQGDWYPEQRTVSDWVKYSQEHQANATTLMTDAFRRRADILSHTAIHLLIDAWPAGWMKTIVGCDRVPKKAYYAYADSLIPLRVNLRGDRNFLHAKETYEIEAWALNDTSFEEEVEVLVQLRQGNQVLETFAYAMTAPAANSVVAGFVPLTMPEVTEKTICFVEAVMLKKDGTCVSTERKVLTVYPTCDQMHDELAVAFLGTRAEQLCEALAFSPCESTNAKHLVVSQWEGNESLVEAALDRGANVVLLTDDVKMESFRIQDLTIETVKSKKVFFADCREDLRTYDFNMLYNANEDYIDFVGRKAITSNRPGEELVFTYGGKAANGDPAPKVHRPMVEKFAVGNGTLYAISLLLEGRVGANANLDQFLVDCVKGIL